MSGKEAPRPGLVHRGRGQPSPRRLADPVRAPITHLMTTWRSKRLGPHEP